MQAYPDDYVAEPEYEQVNPAPRFNFNSILSLVIGGLVSAAVMLSLTLKLVAPFDVLVPWVVFCTWICLIVLGLLHLFLMIINTNADRKIGREQAFADAGYQPEEEPPVRNEREPNMPPTMVDPNTPVRPGLTPDSQRYLPDVDTLRRAYRPISKNQIFIIEEGSVETKANTWQATRRRLLGTSAPRPPALDYGAEQQ